ncbi:MAG: sialidase family protein [Mariniphaga sp.]|nr:sialidase family protein [Mariniphaga sp.]
MKILLKNVCIACFFVNTSINLIFATNNNGVRVSWDYNSYFEQTEVKVVNKDYIETECFYPRIKKLKDGSLLMVFMNHRVGYDIFVRKSYDNGLTWSDAYMVRQR